LVLKKAIPDESNEAYRMLKDGDLIKEVQQAVFSS